MMLLADATGTDTTNLLGYTAITGVGIFLNQMFSIYRGYRKDRAKEANEAVATKVQARRDELAIRKDELAVCAAEDDHVVTGYERLLARTNQRLSEVEKELTDVYVKLGNCEKEHARTEERCKHFEQRLSLVETKYVALRKKLPGLDSDTISVPEA